jgi:DNA repair ATPase RecN
MPTTDDYLATARKKVDGLFLQLTHAEKSVSDERKNLAKSVQALEDTGTARKVAQEVAQQLQQKAHSQIAGIVTKCLGLVFDEPYEFKIEFEQKRGKTEAKLLFREGVHDMNPMEEGSGGVIDVAAFALRLTNLMLATPKLRKLIVLDEPFKGISIENAPKIGRMLKVLAKELKVQIVFVTHNRLMRSGKVVELS